MSGGSILVRGGNVIARPGQVLENASVSVSHGRIAAVGQIQASDGHVSETIDADGRWVTAGLVDAHTHVGINEGSQGSPGVDTNESSRPDTAGVRAMDAVDIHGRGFTDAIAGGVTTVLIKPGSSNPIGGLTVAIKTWGAETIDGLWLGRDVSIKSALGENPKTSSGGPGPLTRMGIAAVIRQRLEDAKHYAAQAAIATRDNAPHRRDLDLEALSRLLDGELQWDVHAHRHDDIATALRIAEEFELRLVINHGTEAHRLVGTIAERGIPVVFGPAITPAIKVELAGFSIATLVTFADAGVPVAIMSDHPESPIGLLATQAVLAVREGLDPDIAFGAITTTAAMIYGLDDRVGALEPGLDGDVVVWSGHPLDGASRPDIVIVDGRVAYRHEQRETQ